MCASQSFHFEAPAASPVDFARTIVSHGVAELPTNRVELEARTLETTLPVPRGARTVRISVSGGRLRIDAVAGKVGGQAGDVLTKTVAHMFRLNQDLSGFYALIGEDGELSWSARGAGRMLRDRPSSRTSSRRSEPSYEPRMSTPSD
jgi:hypothetical protein